MERDIRNIRTTLEEENRLLDEMLSLMDELRQALVQRDAEALFNLGTKQQTLTVRLQIIRETQENLAHSLHRKLTPEQQLKGTGLKSVLRAIDAGEDLMQVRMLEHKLAELRKKNDVNEELLKKQFHSLTAFQQLLDMVQGAESVYDRQGEVQNSQRGRRLEQHG